MDHNYFLNMNNVRNDNIDNQFQFKQAKTDRRNKDSKLSLTVRNPKNINNKRIHQLKKNTSRPSTHGPKTTKPSLNNNNTTHQYGTSLFCAFVGGTNTPARYCNAKLYYFKLFVGGTLVRDLIPCKNSNNVVGMYDVVNNVFYTSPNGNAFVAGPSVNLNYVTNGLIFHLDGINKGTGADWVD